MEFWEIILIYFYTFIVLMAFVFLWARHFYLVHYKLNRFMSVNLPIEWKKMKENTGWYRPAWATLYFSKAVYDFIWHSEEDFGKENIVILRKKIKAFAWELPSYFAFVIVITLLLIWSGVFR